jgi:DNA-binding transcriptional ArsR family regulator
MRQPKNEKEQAEYSPESFFNYCQGEIIFMKVLALILVIGSISIVGVPFHFFDQNLKSGGCCGVQGCKCADSGKQCTCNHALPKSGCSANSTTSGDATRFSLYSRIRRFIVRGYQRLSERTILDQEKRQHIYNLIVEKPGIDLKRIIAYTGWNESTLRYHLWQMKTLGKIKIISNTGNLSYFENHGRYSEDEQRDLALKFLFSVSDIISILRSSPGLTRGEIADILQVSGPTVTRRMQRLINKGLVSQQRDGKYSRYYPVESNQAC